MYWKIIPVKRKLFYGVMITSGSRLSFNKGAQFFWLDFSGKDLIVPNLNLK